MQNFGSAFCEEPAFSMAWHTSQSAWSRIQNCGEVLNRLDNRSAVSAVIRPFAAHDFVETVFRNPPLLRGVCLTSTRGA